MTTVSRSDKYAAAGLIALAISACSSESGSGPIRGPRANNPPESTAAGSAAGAATSGSNNDTPPGTGGPGSTLITVTQPTGAAGSGLKDGQCARQDLNATRVTPTIWLVIDGSGSMVEGLNPGDMMSRSRWPVLREALMDPAAGIVKPLEHEVMWGMIMYDGPGGGVAQLPDGGVAMFDTPPADTCPRLVAVNPARDNFAAIDAMYPMQPLGGSTPTHRAMASVVEHLPMGGAGMLDTQVNPTIVVLATDGAPNDFCEMGGGGFFDLPPDPAPMVVEATKQLALNDVKTYVISLAGDDQNLYNHLVQVAEAGNTGKPPFQPTSKDELVQTFKDIIGPETSCDVALSGKVKVGTECLGMLSINGKPLKCNDPDGWVLRDTSTVTIQGAACVEYKMNIASLLHADFPCESIALN